MRLLEVARALADRRRDRDLLYELQGAVGVSEFIGTDIA